MFSRLEHDPRLLNPSASPEPQFGWFEDDGTLIGVRFGLDSEGYPWFSSTDEEISLGGLVVIGKKSKTTQGECSDTGEYFSPLAITFRSLGGQAPEGTVVVGGRAEGGCGTRTWEETVHATYYGNASSPVASQVKSQQTTLGS